METVEIVKALQNREGVETVEIAPYAPYEISVDGHVIKGTGPAVLLIITD